VTLQWRVRPAEAGDEAGWRRLWNGYCGFYEVSISEDVTGTLWRRIVDGRAGIQAVVAESLSTKMEPQLIGFGNYVLHPYTWGKGVMCYLEDLFVAEHCRRAGVGRALIEALIKMGYDNGWARVYWHTHESNGVARSLYDKVIPVDPFVRYVVHLR
jgi:GNAT superfamily N-acetyltransferase